MPESLGGDQPRVGERSRPAARRRRTASAGRRGRGRRGSAPGRRTTTARSRRTRPPGCRRTRRPCGRTRGGSGGRSPGRPGTGRRGSRRPPSARRARAARSRASRSAARGRSTTAPSEWATTASRGPEPGEHGVQRLAELDAVGTPRPGRARVGVAVGGRVEQDDAMPGGDERLDERGELAAQAAPAVDQVDHGPLAEDVSADLRTPEDHGERLRAPGQRCRRQPGRQGEPQVTGQRGPPARERRRRRSGRRSGDRGS